MLSNYVKIKESEHGNGTNSYIVTPRNTRETFSQYLESSNSNFFFSENFTGNLINLLFNTKKEKLFARQSSFDILCKEDQLVLLIFLTETLSPFAQKNLLDVVKKDNTCGMASILYYNYNKSIADKNPFSIAGDYLNIFHNNIKEFQERMQYLVLRENPSYFCESTQHCYLNVLKLNLIKATLEKYGLFREDPSLYMESMMYITYNDDIASMQTILDIWARVKIKNDLFI